jgi:hypothetical protein
MNVLVAGREALFDVSGVLLTTKDNYNSEGGWDREVRYPKYRAASNVFSNPLPKIALYG